MSSDRLAARMEWLAAQAPLGASLVGHEVLARTATPEEIPEGARRIGRAAEAAGFDVATTYARDEGGDNVMVSMRHPATGARVVGVWVGKTFDLGYTDHGIVDGPGLRAALMLAAEPEALA